MAEPEKITIIEGPPPTFEMVNEAWMLGMTEGPFLAHVAMCRLRSQNAPALVERCYRAWRDEQSVSLEYRDDNGLTQEAPIVAVRWLEVMDGQVLLVWVRMDAVLLDAEEGWDDWQDDIDDDSEAGFDPTL
jgi:hypothetical protein